MYLYVAECLVREGKSKDLSNPVKIGVTKDLQRRINQLQTGCPFEIKYIIILKMVSDKQAYKMEKVYHQSFKRERMMGEWFQPRVKNSKLWLSLLQKAQLQVQTGDVDSSMYLYKSQLLTYSKKNQVVHKDKVLSRKESLRERLSLLEERLRVMGELKLIEQE